MKLLISKGGVQVRFRNKKYIEIFNKFGKRCIFLIIDIKVTYYFSVWVRQTLIYVSEVISGAFNFEESKEDASFKKGEVLLRLSLFSPQFKMV